MAATYISKLRISKLWVYALLYLCVLYLPVMFLPVFSFNDGTVIAFPLQGFTLKWYSQLFESSALLAALENTLIVGVVASVVSTFIGILAASALSRYRFKGSNLIHGVIMTPLFMPGIIIATSLLILFIQFGLYPSLLTVILGHVLLCIPFSIAVLKSSFDQFDDSLEEAAIDLGESFWGALIRVVLPVIAPGIVSSLLVTFTVSFDEFVLAFFLSGTEPTLPVYIWSQVRFPGKLPSVLALGTLLIVVSIVFLVAAEWIKRRGERALTINNIE